MRTFPRNGLARSLLCLVLSPASQAADPTVTVRPQDTGGALVNPAMGWTLHFYSNRIENYGSKLAPSDTLDDFPGLSTVYLRVPWSFLEPEEGRFDWSLLDTPAQQWTIQGKQIAMRISCTESWMRYATPQWVEQAGARGYDFTPRKGAHEGGVFWEPDYDDPVFLEKLDGFLQALAERYDGNPNVAFIDVGSYGVWGEGHTYHSSRITVDDSVKRKHLDLYLAHFKKTLLALNDDYVGNQVRTPHAPLADYALSRGVTLRDDSILVQPPPRSWYHAELAQPFWPRLPVVLEHEHFGSSKQKRAWDGELLLKAVEDYHASYMSIHWWPRELLEENREVIDRINLRLGYRLQLREIAWPRRVRLGEPLVVTSRWANAGVAPCYPGGHVAITLKDDQGGIVAVHVDESFNVRDLEVGPPGQAEAETLSMEFAWPGSTSTGPEPSPAQPSRAPTTSSSPSVSATGRLRSPCPSKATTASAGTGWGRSNSCRGDSASGRWPLSFRSRSRQAFLVGCGKIAGWTFRSCPATRHRQRAWRTSVVASYFAPGRSAGMESRLHRACVAAARRTGWGCDQQRTVNGLFPRVSAL